MRRILKKILTYTKHNHDTFSVFDKIHTELHVKSKVKLLNSYETNIIHALIINALQRHSCCVCHLLRVVNSTLFNHKCMQHYRYCLDNVFIPCKLVELVNSIPSCWQHPQFIWVFVVLGLGPLKSTLMVRTDEQNPWTDVPAYTNNHATLVKPHFVEGSSHYQDILSILWQFCVC